MKKERFQAPASNHPEFAVRREMISSFFSPPLPKSTFYDLVNKGKIIPMKALTGFYLLNDSLRRLGLREVAELPNAPASRSPEDITRMAFHAIDPELFPAPSWLLTVDSIDSVDVRHAELVFTGHVDQVEALANDRLKIAYLQGVLDFIAVAEAQRESSGE